MRNGIAKAVNLICDDEINKYLFLFEFLFISILEARIYLGNIQKLLKLYKSRVITLGNSRYFFCILTSSH